MEGINPILEVIIRICSNIALAVGYMFGTKKLSLYCTKDIALISPEFGEFMFNIIYISFEIGMFALIVATFLRFLRKKTNF